MTSVALLLPTEIVSLSSVNVGALISLTKYKIILRPNYMLLRICLVAGKTFPRAGYAVMMLKGTE